MPRAAVDSKKKTREEKEGFFLKIALLMNFSWAQTKPLLFYRKKGAKKALQINKVRFRIENANYYNYYANGSPN